MAIRKTVTTALELPELSISIIYMFVQESNTYLINTKAIATVAGAVCTNNICLLAVAAPYNPATATQPKKKRATLLLQTVSVIKNDQIRPAAKKPLYKPWLPAITLVAGNKSFGKPLNTLGPRVVHANISNQTM
jgi:hypothetical protein